MDCVLDGLKWWMFSLSRRHFGIGDDLAEHNGPLARVLLAERKSGSILNFKKMELFVELSYLGHLNPQKVADQLTLCAPTNVAELRSFLGLASFLSTVCHGSLRKLFTQLLKKNSNVEWGP